MLNNRSIRVKAFSTAYNKATRVTSQVVDRTTINKAVKPQMRARWRLLSLAFKLQQGLLEISLIIGLSVAEVLPFLCSKCN